MVKIQICIIQLQRSVRLQSAPAPHTSISSQARETTFLHVGPTLCIVLPDAANISFDDSLTEARLLSQTSTARPFSSMSSGTTDVVPIWPHLSRWEGLQAFLI